MYHLVTLKLLTFSTCSKVVNAPSSLSKGNADMMFVSKVLLGMR